MTFRMRHPSTTSAGGEGLSEGGRLDVVGVGWMNKGTEVERGNVAAAVVSGMLSSLLLICILTMVL